LGFFIVELEPGFDTIKKNNSHPLKFEGKGEDK
jgi:hypothetical protein